MSEAEVIAATPAPRTRQSLGADLGAAGLAAGMTVLVHASLSAIGWVAGGPVAVIEALFDAVGATGTLVMPAQSGHLSDPARWRAPPVPTAWIEVIRSKTPAYDPATTPTRGMGAIAELFRTWPGTERSAHPNCSFTANGPEAADLLGDHRLDSPLGEHSPLARLYERNATILLIGVGFDSCTMLHLAEMRAWPDRKAAEEAAPVLVDGARRWVTYRAPPTGEMEHFSDLGQALMQTGQARRIRVGSADSIVIGARDLVDAAVARWRVLPPVA
ncbi:MAG: AAC(3) family N-acetyltransferase [Alphaproteobacteria bacterium]|nr:AAC(3) family N-acetyltransferase [Alphaproteobacteria bacterium]